MSDTRRDPDVLLGEASREEERSRRGRLRVYFGACAGVGKTCAMLAAAQAERAEGRQVYVGVVVTHGRARTRALAEGLPTLAPRIHGASGARFEELDLDAALALRPSLLLVDELAHTNAPGGRHTRRWQDVMELVHAGIEVWTTLNVQHLESVSDVVARHTGVVVQERVPDRLLDEADEVELIDLPPEELRARLSDGFVYEGDAATRAASHFFQIGNLKLLRQLALARMADRADVELARHQRLFGGKLPEGGRILVCVSPSPLSSRLVRATRRTALRLRSPWEVVWVQTPSSRDLPSEARDRVMATLRLAERLGAPTHVLTGDEPAQTLLEWARSHSVRRIVVGRPGRPRWKDHLLGSFVDALVRNPYGIDVHVIQGEEGEEPPTAGAQRSAPAPPLKVWIAAVASVVLCTGVAALLYSAIDVTSVALLYVLAVVGVAGRLGRTPALVATCLSVLCFDFFFVAPRFTLRVADPEAYISFAVLAAVSLIVSDLTTRLTWQVAMARRRQEHAEALLDMVRALRDAADPQALADVTRSHLRRIFCGEASVWLVRGPGVGVVGADPFPEDEPLGVANWCYHNGHPAGLGTDTLPGARATYYPLRAAQGVVGVVGLRSEPAAPLEPEDAHTLEAMLAQVAHAALRLAAEEKADQARLEVAAERTRSALLSSVSHDLRTPLASITGAAAALAEGDTALGEEVRRELAESIRAEGFRLSARVHDLLQMSRLEAGALSLRLDWCDVGELLGAALGAREAQLSDRAVHLELEPDLPLVQGDAALLEQVVTNLLDNVAAHTPPGAGVTLRAHRSGPWVALEVEDQGPGAPPEELPHLFDKFHRGPRSQGSGLGLAICRGFIEAHGGTIAAHSGPGVGLRIVVQLPLPAEQPTIEEEPAPPHRRQEAP